MNIYEAVQPAKAHANRQSKQHKGGLQGMEAFSYLFILQQAALFARRRT